MDKKDFKKALENIFKDFEFQHKNKAFYHDNGNIITVIAAQKSNYDNSYYINFGFLVKEESSDLEYPRESDCDLFGRFVIEFNGERYQSINLDKFTIETFSSSVIEFMNTNIKPAIEFGLLKYLEINPKAVHTMSLKAKKYLNI